MHQQNLHRFKSRGRIRGDEGRIYKRRLGRWIG
jgi:hypothetical protein